MYRASADLVMPTSIIGSLPRPSWYTVQLGRQSFLEAMVNARWREQYEDAVSVHLRAQEVAGLDICTDGDNRFDDLVGGMSWQSYPVLHMDGFSPEAVPAAPQIAAAGKSRSRLPAFDLAAAALLSGPVATDIDAWFAELDRFADVPFMEDGRRQPPMPAPEDLFA